MANKLDGKLWKIFSEYIRRRDAKLFSGEDIGKCITCSHADHWKYMDAGHFISRRHLSTKFSEKNNNLQCKGCNGFGAGKQFEYSIEINKKYGNGSSELLLMESRKAVKWGNFDYEFRIEFYKKEIEKLK